MSMIKSVNEPDTLSRERTLTPQSLNEPLPLPEGPPSVEGLNPDSSVAGTDQLLVIHGANFTPGCVIQLGDTALDTVYEREDKINAVVPGSTPAGEYPVTVNLGPLATEATTFTITEAEGGEGGEGTPEPEALFEDATDPDEVEDELEQSKEEGDFKSMHRPRRRR